MKKLLLLLISFALIGGTAYGQKKMSKMAVRGANGQFVFGQGYVPRDANIFGFVNLKSILKNPFVKTFAEHAKLDTYLAQAKLTRADLNTVVVFARIDDFMKAKNPKAAVILQKLNVLKTPMGVQIKKSEKLTHKGVLVYKNRNGKEFATIHNGHSILGTGKGVKGAIDAKTGKGGVNNRLKSVLSKLKTPMGAAAFGISKKMLAMVAPQLDNPQISAQMPALKGFVMNSKAAAFGGFLKGKTAVVEIVVKSAPKDCTAMATAMTMMKAQMAPMLPAMTQQITKQAGQKAATMIMNTYKSLKFEAKGAFLKITFSFDFSQVTPDDIKMILKKLR